MLPITRSEGDLRTTSEFSQVGVNLPAMDIEQFYDADPRRRPSAELELGTEWHDKHGVRYELNFIEDTGELYVMQEPPPMHEWADPFGGIHLRDTADWDERLGVRVIANIDSVDKLHQIVQGWQDAMSKDSSVEWLAERLRVAGVATGANPSS